MMKILVYCIVFFRKTKREGIYIGVLTLNFSKRVIQYLDTILRVIVENFEIRYIAIRKKELITTSVILHLQNRLTS